MLKRFLAMLLAVVLVAGCLPMGVLAEGEATSAGDFAALQAALEAGGKVKLTGDVELTALLTVPAGKTVTLDLNGKTISSTNEAYHIKNEGNLTIIDSREGGKDGEIKMTPASESAAVSALKNTGTLTINGGKFTTTTKSKTAQAVHSESASVTINGGTFEANYDVAGASSAYTLVLLGDTSGSSVATINGGTFIAKSKSNNNSRCAAVFANCDNTKKITITINGGTFESERQSTRTASVIRFRDTQCGATVVINDGTFTAKAPASATTDDRMFAGSMGALTINGGSFTCDTKVFTDARTATITGGTFVKWDGTKNDIASYVKEAGFSQNDKGIVAQHVTTCDALVAAMAKGGNISLGADIALTAVATVPAGKTVTLDLNGKTISSNSEVNRVENNGTLTIVDSRDGDKDGEIIITPANDAATVMAIKNTGKLTIEGGKFTASAKVKTVYTLYSVAPSVTINGGTFTASQTGGKGVWGSASALALNGDGSADPVATINGGTFVAENATPENNRCAALYAGAADATKITITINGGTFEGKRTNARSGSAIRFRDKTCSTVVVINGGTFAADMVSGNVDDKLFANTFGSLTIKGGTFTYDGSVFTAERKATITGGTFLKADGTKNDISTYVTEGYEQDATGKVVAKSTVPSHSHKLCDDAACADHGNLTFEEWTSTTTLPTTAGNYYLTEDVQLKNVWNLKANVNLCLNGHTITAPANERTVALNAGYTLSITDCGETGKITGGVRNWGGVINVNAGATFNLYGGQLTGNKTKDNNGNGQAGAVYLSEGSTTAVGGTFNMYGGSITKNTAYNGGAIYASKYSVINMFGGEITENTATNGSGAALLNLGSTFNMTGGSITGNTSAIDGGAITTTSAVVSVSGKAVITGNKAGDVASNVYMKGTGLLKVGTLDSSAQIGVSVSAPVDGYVLSSALGGANVLANFSSDNEDYEIAIENDVLILDEKVYHKHNLNDCNAHDADVSFQPWESTTSLPSTAGNYYLTGNVQLKGVWNLKANVNLCLNGFTITAPANERSIALNPGYTLSITDHEDLGKITGGVRNWGGVINVNAGATFNLYGGQLTGNTNKTPEGGDGQGGAVYLSAASGSNAGGVFNMYGGSINNNVAYRGGAIYMLKGSTFNMYGGIITENKTNNRSAAIYATGATINMEGGEISNNTGVGSGGAISLMSKTVMTMNGGKINYNKGSSGGAMILESAGTKFVMNGGEFVGNSGSYGGALYVSIDTVFEMNGGLFADNTARQSGGAMLLQRANVTLAGGEIKNNTAATMGGGVEVEGATLTVTGTKITGNTAQNGGGIYIANNGVDYQPSVTLAGGEITGNKATSVGGGVSTKDAQFTKLELSGNLVIQDNTADGKTSNLFLPATAVFTVGQMGENAKVGLRATRIYGSMSAKTETDCTAAFTSDNTTLKVIYKDQTVYLEPIEGHTHCLCNDKSTECKHEAISFAPWSDPNNLPSTEGNYYLTVDVKLSAVRNVTKDINLCLNGHTITAPENDRTFALNAGYTLSITDHEDLGKITGGVRNWGGVINVNAGATFNLYGGQLTGNTNKTPDEGDGQGGAVYLSTATDTTAGGVFNMYGGSINNNVAYRGGAVYMTKGSTFNMYGGIITENTATNRSGAIFATGATFNLYDGEIVKNTGKSTGGAISMMRASTMTMNGGKINYNEGTSGGALILESTGTKFVMNGGEFIGNSGSYGAALYVSTGTTFEMNGGLFAENNARKSGGAMCLQNSTTTINDGELKNNTSKEGGGAINLYDKAVLTINGGTFTGNTGKQGGALCISGKGTFNLNGGLITKNKSTGAGGGIILLNTGTKMTMTGGEISHNNGSTGGGIFVSTRTEMEMTGGKITYNTVKKHGGGICMLLSKVTIRGGSISYNVCTDRDAQGAGIKLDGGTLNIHYVTMDGNQLTHKLNSGGTAIASYKGTEKSNGVTKVTNSVINLYGGTIMNHTGRSGGTVQLLTETTFNMYGGTIRNSEAVLDGGAVAVYSKSSFNMYGGLITNSKSAKAGGALYYGKGCTGVLTDIEAYGAECGTDGGFLHAYGLGTKITMKNVKLYGNTAGGIGGGMAMMMESDLDMDDCELYDNTAKKGGGMALSYKTTGRIDNSKIYNNTTTETGGGMYLEVAGCHYFTNVEVTGNTAGTSGGGILTRGDITFTDCLIDGNTAAKSGGGICTSSAWTYDNQYTNGYIYRGQGLILENTTVSNNTAAEKGGGAYLGKKNWNAIIDSTFTGNTAQNGSALYVMDDLKVVGLTATGNTAQAEDGYTVWYDTNRIDGISYIYGIYEMGGNVIIKDNKGAGDVMLCENVVLSNVAEGYGEKTEFGVTLSDGILTNRILGEYNYEGGNLNYTVTYGSRSYEEPEVYVPETQPEEETNEQTQPEETTTEPVAEQGEDNSGLYIGIGAIAGVIVIAAVILVIVKKKKTPAGKE